MNFGIIAAGEGSRLANEGVATPKPLIPIRGIPMIERQLRIFERAGAGKIVVCINDFMPEVRQYLAGFKPAEGVELKVCVQSTPSSMHTFKVISEHLKGHGRFIATTVDTIFDEETFRRYTDAWEQAPAEVEGLMGVTDFVDDEKPLWVSLRPDSDRISAFLDKNTDIPTGIASPRYISGGIYGLGDAAIRVLDECLASGQQRMRNFQRALIANGLDIEAFPFGKIMDIDHADDIKKVNEWLK